MQKTKSTILPFSSGASERLLTVTFAYFSTFFLHFFLLKAGTSSFERVEVSKYLGMSLTNQNSFQEEIKSRLKSGIACYHLVRNVLSSSLLSKILKIKIYRTIILPVVLYGRETC
jgi:hypothetical protein